MKNKHKFLPFLALSVCALVACASASRSVSGDNSNKNLFGANNEEEQVQNPVSFTSDNWSTICALANMGEEAFKEAYVPNESLNDLIGTSRKIEGIGEATLIDYSHDLNGKLNKTGLLTFQITAPIENIKYSDNDSNRWYLEKSTGNIESNIRHYCNNDLFNALPGVIKDNIVVVRKKTLEYTASGIQYRNYTDEKIYPLSLSEYGIPPIDQRDTEGDVYRAYIYDDQTPRKVELPEATWLRSPSIALNNPDKAFCLTKTEEGEVIQAVREVGSPTKLVCAFTIGMQRETKVTLDLDNCISDKGNTITGLSGEKISLTLSCERAWKLPNIPSEIPFFEKFFNYDASSGKLEFRQPYIDSSISVSCLPNEFDLITSFTNISSDDIPTTIVCGETVTFTLKPTNYYRLPDNINISNVSSFDYDQSTGIVSFTAPADEVTVTASAKKKKFEELTWSEISSISASGKASDWCSVGTTKNLTVNGINQPVRVIGFNHDELADGSGKKAGITFEFVNLLSDSNGYSLATVWNWMNGSSSTNYDYPNSNLRKALDGEGSGSLAWYQKGSTTKSSYGTALSMLPADLQSEIKKVKKPIATTSSYGVTSYDTKLFTLSYREMTASGTSSYAKEEGSAYAFYTGSGDTDANRIKHQPKWHDEAVTTYTKITDGNYAAYNYAGYNSTTDTYGGYSWLRSPYSYDSNRAWRVSTDGALSSSSVYLSAFAVAPAFCI